MTEIESKMNNKKTQWIDFEYPSTDIVSGLPGFGRPGNT